jgi:hypothetical protein
VLVELAIFCTKRVQKGRKSVAKNTKKKKKEEELFIYIACNAVTQISGNYAVLKNLPHADTTCFLQIYGDPKNWSF